ncbi:MAG TPA: MlaA family lipoprotein [Methylomirabilota bacterium]|nr:MlaA family lipoprotein [Methylomirabilota bacterium]
MHLSNVLIKFAVLAFLMATTFGQGTNSPGSASTNHIIVIPNPIGDPIEPFNRAMWSLNKGIMVGAIEPTAKVYRFLTCDEFRDGVRNVGDNLGFPTRLVNNALQGRWSGARDESYRFLCNTVLGVGGFFDVAGKKFDIEPSPADFGQTFGTWGWKPKVYVMLPLLGPSNERDMVGSVGDRFVNPLSYFEPYSYIPNVVTYNNLAHRSDHFIRLASQQHDPYFLLRYAWTIRRNAKPVPLKLADGEQQDRPSLETLQSVFFTAKDPEFVRRAKTSDVRIPATGRELPYTTWLQKGPAPLVFLLPGMGAHRFSGGTVALAELLYNSGRSVVVVSSGYNHEFLARASTAAVPGYAPVDVQDMLNALRAVNDDLTKEGRARVTQKALIGYSMGGFQTLQVAALLDRAPTNDFRFDRYIAIDTPVSLAHGIEALDDHFRAALEWPPEQRTERIGQTFLKVAALTEGTMKLNTDTQLPFSAQESKFLIGLAFKLHLRDIIYLTQSRTNLGVLKEPVRKWRREEVYEEILQYSFAEYLQKFVVPYYRQRGLDLNAPEEFQRAVDIRAHRQVLAGQRDVRVIVNANDILLKPEDVQWLEKTFDAKRLKIFPAGGHLGNLGQPEVQEVILQGLAGL